MKVKVYANIAVCEVEISKKQCRTIQASHLNAIPDTIWDQVQDQLGGEVELLGIERIDTSEGDTLQEY